jgi:uncharacterized protein (TIGR02996 family)
MLASAARPVNGGPVSTADAFLRDICDHPDDDAPRLVFADWLEEHDDEARAEFIRVECELERTEEYSPRWRELSARQLALIRAHKKEWVKPFKGWTYSTHFRRGFVETVMVNPKRFTSRAAELFRLAPIRQLNFTRLATPELRVPAGTVEAIAAVPELRRARGLGFGSQYLGDDVLRAFLAAADLRHVTALVLNRCRLTPAGAAALAAAPGLAGLTTLDLSFNGPAVGLVAALARAPAFRLEALDLTYNEVTDADAVALAASPHLARLTALSLGHSRMSDAGLRALVQSPHLAALTDLELGQAFTGTLTDAGLAALAQSPCPPRLRSLVLAGAHVGDAGLAALAGYRHLDALRKLDLSKVRTPFALLNAAGITDAGARVLAMLPGLAGLRWLNLENNALTDSGAQALLASPHLAGLGYLNLKGNRLSTDTQRAFRQRYGPGVCTFSRA